MCAHKVSYEFHYGTNQTRASGVRLLALEFGKIAKSDFVYTLAYR